MIRSTTPSWVASCAQLVAVAAGDDRDRAVGHAGSERLRRGRTWASTAFECAAVDDPRSTIALPDLRQSAEQSIGHVRARLVDHGHDAERHAHAPHVEAVLEPVAVDRLADRVGQRGDRAHVARDAREALLVELQPVEQALRGDRPPRPPPCRARWPRGSRPTRCSSASAIASSAAFFVRGVEPGQLARRARLACCADLGDRLGGGGHAARVPAPSPAPGAKPGGPARARCVMQPRLVG